MTNIIPREGDMAKTVSDKNTKTEIIEAYNEVLAQLKDQKALNRQAA